jgi:hypothetical protein
MHNGFGYAAQCHNTTHPSPAMSADDEQLRRQFRCRAQNCRLRQPITKQAAALGIEVLYALIKLLLPDCSHCIVEFDRRHVLRVLECVGENKIKAAWHSSGYGTPYPERKQPKAGGWRDCDGSDLMGRLLCGIARTELSVAAGTVKAAKQAGLDPLCRIDR